MTGRDIKSFVVAHRTRIQDKEEQHHLISRAMIGLRSDRYKNVYDQSIKTLKKHKEKANATNSKISEIQHRTEFGREQAIVRQHKMIWQETPISFEHSASATERECENSINSLLQMCHNYDQKYANELQTCFADVDEEVEKYENSVVLPIKELRKDLLHRMKNSFKAFTNKDGEDILIEVSNVQQQSDHIYAWLLQQRSILDEDLEASQTKEDVMFGFEEAVPLDILLEECPNNSIKNSALHLFVDLHSRCKITFDEQTTKLDELKALLRKCCWSSDELWVFDKVEELYKHYCPPHLRNKLPQLLSDMIKRLLLKSHMEIFDISSLKMKMKFALDTRHSILSSYRRDYNALHTKVLALFSEAWQDNQMAVNKDAVRKEQLKICDGLHEELEYLRSRQEEIRRLEWMLEERKRNDEEEKKEKEKKLINERRKEDKKKISHYHVEKMRRLKIAAAENERRLKELKIEMEKQKIYDKQRIKYRQSLYEIKLNAAQEATQLKEEEVLAKNKRLDALRSKVFVDVLPDPARMVQDTAASRARTSQYPDPHLPLFPLHGYTSKQMDRDVRLRAEAAMREAGIHNTEYARHIMSTLAPPTRPRPDNDSSGLRTLLHTDA